MSTIKTLFDMALNLPEGEKLVVDFDSLADWRSKRTMLYREKQKYSTLMKSRGIIDFPEVMIQQEIDQHKKIYKLTLSSDQKSYWAGRISRVSKQGEKSEVAIAELLSDSGEPVYGEFDGDSPTDTATRAEELRNEMRAQDLTEEEIDEILKSEGLLS